MSGSSQHKRVFFYAKAAVIAGVMAMSQFVFAVDGFLMNNRSKAGKTFSTIKNDVRLSLNAGYSFQGNKMMLHGKNAKKGMLNTMVTYQKGNVTYYMPFKSKTVLQKFKTPSAPVIR